MTMKKGTPSFCSATLQGRAHEAKASHYISKHRCHCKARPPLSLRGTAPFCHCEARSAEAISHTPPGLPRFARNDKEKRASNDN